MIVIAIY